MFNDWHLGFAVQCEWWYTWVDDPGKYKRSSWPNFREHSSAQHLFMASASHLALNPCSESLCPESLPWVPSLNSCHEVLLVVFVLSLCREFLPWIPGSVFGLCPCPDLLPWAPALASFPESIPWIPALSFCPKLLSWLFFQIEDTVSQNIPYLRWVVWLWCFTTQQIPN